MKYWLFKNLFCYAIVYDKKVSLHILSAICKGPNIDEKGVDIFAGAGGMSLGAISSGIEIVLSIDCDESSVKTYKRNHPDTLVIQDDIKNIDPMRYIKGNDIYVVLGTSMSRVFIV